MTLIRTIPETGSTNDDVAALAREGAPEGLWLRAERQTGGRGRQGRDWHSPPGNLYASTLVRMRGDDPPAPTLALVAAVAVHEVCSLLLRHSRESGNPASSFQHKGKRDSRFRGNDGEEKPNLQIKWPNDLMVGTAKLAGILLERSDESVVIGFGVNLASHPQALDRATTSIAVLTGSAPEAATVLEMLAEGFARWLARWRHEGISSVRARWLEAAHPVGTALATSQGDGLFDGLDEQGALRLRLADGSTRVIHAGDVFLI